jgi:acyl-coenzyme A thioesterase PaaI-like protein
LTSEVTRKPGIASNLVAGQSRAASTTGPASPPSPSGTIAPPSPGGRPVIDTPTGRFEFAAHNCFACGTLNAGGLGLALHVEPGRSWVELALERRFEGWEGVVHGGILCTILDEVMAWALVGDDNWGVTARIAVDFRRPVVVGVPIRAEGWITQSRRRVVDTAGQIVDGTTGARLATATGVYLAATPDRKRALRERYAYRPSVVAASDQATEHPDSVDRDRR